MLLLPLFFFLPGGYRLFLVDGIDHMQASSNRIRMEKRAGTSMFVFFLTKEYLDFFSIANLVCKFTVLHTCRRDELRPCLVPAREF